jgi:predicted peptidase
MGGMGTFELVRRMPGVFAAAVPICGGANPATAPALKTTAWWIFHGEKDDVVPLKYSTDMVTALSKIWGTDLQFTSYPGMGHNSWDPAFAEPQLLRWLISKRR